MTNFFEIKFFYPNFYGMEFKFELHNYMVRHRGKTVEAPCSRELLPLFSCQLLLIPYKDLNKICTNNYAAFTQQYPRQESCSHSNIHLRNHVQQYPPEESCSAQRTFFQKVNAHQRSFTILSKQLSQQQQQLH